MLSSFSILSAEATYFMLVYEHKSINSAARKINQSSGNISRLISRLEGSIGQPLFARHQTGLCPTELGDKLYRALLAAKSDFISEMSTRDERSQKVRIGFSPTVGYAHFASHFLQPLIELRYTPQFVVASSLELVEQIKGRELDLVIVPQAIKLPGLISRAIDSENLVLASLSGKPQRVLITSSEMLGLERILKSVTYEQRWILNDYFVIGRFLEQNGELMGLLPSSLLQTYAGLKALTVFPREGKITALSWPSSPGAQLIKARSP